jgi:SET family sugar efflux transporter-like MFS transporter
MNVVVDVKRFLQVEGAKRLFLTLYFYGIGMGILAPMNSIYLRDSIGLSKGQIVSVFAISLFLNMITTMVVGIVSDRMKRKKNLAMLASALCMCGLMIYIQADNYMSALIGMCIIAAPSGLIMGQLFAMSRKHFQHHAGEIVEMAQIWLRTGFSVGFFTGLLIGANLYLAATFKGVLWGNLSGYVILFFMLFFYKEAGGETVIKADAKNSEPFSLTMLVALLMLACADAIRGLYLPLVVNELFGIPQLMSYIWSIQAIFELLFMTVAGYWAARFGSKRIILIGGIGAFFTFAIYASSPALPMFFLVQPLYSFFVSILYAIAMGYVQRMFISRSGFGSSLYVLISLTASLFGYMLPLLIEGYSPLIFIIPAILVIVSLLLITMVLISERRSLKHQ